MVEPITTALSLATIATKLIISGQKAAKDPDWTTGDDLKALGTLFDGVKKLISENKTLKNGELDPMDRLATIHTMMITKAFNDALKEHLSLNRRKKEHKELNKYIIQQLANHKNDLAQYNAASMHQWLAQPTTSKIYLALWAICSNETQSAISSNLIIHIDEDQEHGKGKRLFELAFYKHYAKYSTGQLGKELNQLQDHPKDWQKRLYRQLLLVNAFDLPNHSVFPNDRSGPSLKQVYVEPEIYKEDDDDTFNALSTLKHQCTQTIPSLITADFGFGKSLTSRMFAAELAKEALTGKLPSEHYPIPVRIVCQHHMRSDQLSFETLKNAFKSACMEQIRTLVKLSRDSDLLPSLTDSKFHLIIDGLDEIIVQAKICTNFFNDLYDYCSDQLFITVFSRPGVIPQDVMAMIKKEKLQHFTIQGFDEQRTNEWLTKWNNTHRKNQPIPQDDFKKVLNKNLKSIPIMLFMTATVWDKIKKSSNNIPRAELYEHFVRAMAKGKADSKTGDHGVIQDASTVLLEQISHKLIEEKPTKTDAMLWLMGRVAWERHCLKTNKKQDLKLSDIQHILNRELDINHEHINLVQQGICVAAQTNLANENDNIFFQHESFAEFFIARFWVHSLQYMFNIGDKHNDYQYTLNILSNTSFYTETVAQQEFLLEIGVIKQSADNFLEQCRNFIKHQPLSPNIKKLSDDKIMNIKNVAYQLLILNTQTPDNKDTAFGIIERPDNKHLILKNSHLKDILLEHSNINLFTTIKSSMTEVKFYLSNIASTNFLSNTFKECDFVFTHIIDSRFSNCTFNSVSWSSACLIHTLFINCTFINCAINDVFFNTVRLINCQFENSLMIQCLGKDNVFKNSDLPKGHDGIFAEKS